MKEQLNPLYKKVRGHEIGMGMEGFTGAIILYFWMINVYL